MARISTVDLMDMLDAVRSRVTDVEGAVKELQARIEVKTTLDEARKLESKGASMTLSNMPSIKEPVAPTWVCSVCKREYKAGSNSGYVCPKFELKGLVNYATDGRYLYRYCGMDCNCAISSALTAHENSRV